MQQGSGHGGPPTHIGSGRGPSAARRGSRNRAGRAHPGPHPQRAIGLTGIRAYPVGFGCTLHLRLREVIPGEQSTFGAFGMFGDSVDPAGEFADYLRFGVGFADGRKATNLDRRHDFDEGPSPDPPALRLVRWEGYDLLAWEVDVWVWGLPPPGPLAFVCAWPAGQLQASGIEIDAKLVLEAADRSASAWPAG